MCGDLRFGEHVSRGFCVQRKAIEDRHTHKRCKLLPVLQHSNDLGRTGSADHHLPNGRPACHTHLKGDLRFFFIPVTVSYTPHQSPVEAFL